MRTYTKAVTAGIAFFNRTFGRGKWRRLINKQTFNMTQADTCALGQAYQHGDYWEAVLALGLGPDEERAYGFMIGSPPWMLRDMEWRRLNQEWRHQLWKEAAPVE